MSPTELITVASIVLGIVGGYTVLVFKIATLTATLSQNTALIIDVRNIVVNQDDRMDKLERGMMGKAERLELELLDRRLIQLETKHDELHRRKGD